MVILHNSNIIKAMAIKSKIFGIIQIILFSALTLSLCSYYFSYAKKIPFSFYDEFWWISDSYLAEYYFKGDFQNKVWGGKDAIDQPMLTRLVFAATLYPQYIKQRRNIKDNFTRDEFTYSEFLISNGFIYSYNSVLNDEYLRSAQQDYQPVEVGYRI